MHKLKEIADQLYKAEKNKTPISPVRSAFHNDRNIDAAYKIQQLVTQKKINEGAKIIGKKIGLTSFAVQAQLGVDEPDFGVLTQDMQIKNHGEVLFSDLMQPKAEAELAFILKQDLDFDNIEMKDVIEAIEHALITVEIVGSRIENWNIKITDTIADNASASHFVLGERQVNLSDIDLEHCQMQLFKNDELVSEGTGKACMGNPLNAMLWLAQTMQNQKAPLKKNDIILSGALGPMTNLSQGDIIKAEIDGFDKISFEVV